MSNRFSNTEKCPVCFSQDIIICLKGKKLGCYDCGANIDMRKGGKVLTK